MKTITHMLATSLTALLLASVAPLRPRAFGGLGAEGLKKRFPSNKQILSRKADEIQPLLSKLELQVAQLPFN